MRVVDEWGVWEEETTEEGVKVRVLLEPSEAWRASIPSPLEPTEQEKARDSLKGVPKTFWQDNPTLRDIALVLGILEKGP